jgi:RNA polymerase sigma factor (sigma-70 family)
MEDLVEQHLELIFWAIGRWRVGLDYDDAYGIAALALCEAAARYDPEKGKFTTYAIWRMRGALLDAWRRRTGLAPQKGAKPPLESLDILLETKFDVPEPADDQDRFFLEEIRWLAEHPRENTWGFLGEREAEMIRRRLAGEALKSIAKSWGVTETRASQIWLRACKRLRAYLLRTAA